MRYGCKYVRACIAADMQPHARLRAVRGRSQLTGAGLIPFGVQMQNLVLQVCAHAGSSAKHLVPKILVTCFVVQALPNLVLQICAHAGSSAKLLEHLVICSVKQALPEAHVAVT